MKLLALLLTVALTGSSIAADPVNAATDSTPAGKPGEDNIFKPTDLAAIQAAMGKTVIIEGAIVAAGANKTESIRFLNFTRNYRDSVTLVFHTNIGNGNFTKDKVAKYVGKKVRAKGVLTERNGAFQINIESLDQIKVQP